MGQLTFAEAEYTVKKRKTRCEKFLGRMGPIATMKKVGTSINKKVFHRPQRSQALSTQSNAQGSCHAAALQPE